METYTVGPSVVSVEVCDSPEVARLRARLAEAEGIVRAVEKDEPWRAFTRRGLGSDPLATAIYKCCWCHAIRPGHTADCTWLRARQYVAEHPEVRT